MEVVIVEMYDWFKKVSGKVCRSDGVAAEVETAGDFCWDGGTGLVSWVCGVVENVAMDKVMLS